MVNPCVLLILICLFPRIVSAQTDFSLSAKPEPDLVHLSRHLPEFLFQLDSATKYGLDKIDYDYEFLKKFAAGESAIVNDDSVVSKKRILAAMNHFFDDLFNGRVPRMSYNGLPDAKNYDDIPALINESMVNDTYAMLADKFQIDHPLYHSLLLMAAAMNDSLLLKPSFARRLKGTQAALHSFRWLYSVLKENESTIVVNIPSATLLLFHYEKPVLESKVIVGKRSTRTPVIASTLTDITIYPYWIVPKSIATKELLPEIKKDSMYLERNNFQVLDKNGKIVSASKVPWSTLGVGNFPYTIRQSTGCDNSLGLIKLNINNPFNIYLHDTPWKVLFESANRFYSHGCVRVQKAKELSHILLKENSVAVDTLNEKATLLGRKPTVLKLPGKVPVLILYNTTWFNMNGEVRFYPDIYTRLE